MTLGDWLRLFKLLSVLLFVGGAVGCLVSSSDVERKNLAAWVVTPGLLLTWLCGTLFALVNQIPVTKAWIGVAVLASIVVHQVAHSRVGDDDTSSSRWPKVWTTVSALVLCIASMIARFGDAS